TSPQSKRRSSEENPAALSRKPSSNENLRMESVEKLLGGTGRRPRPSGNRRPQPATGGRYCGREMPSPFIFHGNVERFIPRRAADLRRLAVLKPDVAGSV